MGGLWPHVTHAEPARRARETAVGDQSHLFAHALTGQSGGCRQHFAHAGATRWAFVADHEDFALFVGARLDGLERVFLAFETMAPSGARLPFRPTTPPVAVIGVSTG